MLIVKMLYNYNLFFKASLSEMIKVKFCRLIAFLISKRLTEGNPYAS